MYFFLLFSFLFFFFAIANLKKFSLCNVIKQIKKVLPNTLDKLIPDYMLALGTPLCWIKDK